MADFQDQESFFTGLSNKKGTKPGFAMKNETFLVAFEGIQIEKLDSDSQVRFVKDKFESCYDWAQVMELILECLEYFYDEGDFQIDCQSSIKAWLSEFEGWGLMFTLLPPDFQKYLLFLYAVMVNKNFVQNVVKTNLEMFYDLTDQYERETQGLPLSDLVPKVEARLLNIISGPERRKMLKIKFLSQRYTLVANFTVEKLRINRTLVEHAAEVVARMVEDAEELEGEIPETLKPVVTDKINDADWVASHWWAKYKFNKENLEDHNQKTVPQVVPDPRVSMIKSFLRRRHTKSFLQTIIGTLHDIAFTNLSSSSPERLFICLASTAAAAVLHYQ